MLQHIKKLLKANIFFIAIFITILIAYLSLMKVPNIPIKISFLDKIEHCIAYFTLSLSWFLYFYKKPKAKYKIAIACVFFGILLEGLQGTMTNYRTADYLDMIANSVGVVLGLITFNQILKKNNVYLQ